MVAREKSVPEVFAQGFTLKHYQYDVRQTLKIWRKTTRWWDK